jgi:predicted ATP-dependent endonuclease of OLD family
MKISFNNFGVIKSAEIDLSKKLTVFCGPNNTGKTYVSYVIYGLSKRTFSLSKLRFLHKSLEGIFEAGVLNLDIEQFLSNHSTAIFDIISKEISSELPRIFGIDKEKSNHLFPNVQFKLERPSSEEIKKTAKEVIIDEKIDIGEEYNISLSKKKNQSILQVVLVKNEKSSKGLDLPKGLIIEFLSERILSTLLDLFIPPAYFAPVERNSIYTFSKELSLQRNILVDKILELNSDKPKNENPFDLIERRATRYPLPVKDGLEISEDLINFKKKESQFFEIAEEIENKVLQGKISVTKDGEVLFSPFKSKSTKLPIHLSSSLVKTLSNFVIYFRHFARGNDFIIIDEPELNLHPDNQVLLTRIFGSIINKGFKILLSTHSDYIIREINNLIMLSGIKTKDEKLQTVGDYDFSELLKPDDVGAYLFKFPRSNSKKVSVTQLEVKPSGFEVETIDKAINSLNDKTEELYFSLLND